MKMPGMKLFGFQSEPSAEALAGEGPTTTYPVPPGNTGTPDAIASIAGGTGSQSMAGINPGVQPITSPNAGMRAANTQNVPSYVTNAVPNMAAAKANGVYGGTKPVGFAGIPPQTPKTAPSISVPEIKTPSTESFAAKGYQFGSNIAPSKPSDSSMPKNIGMPKSVSAPSGFASAKSSGPQLNTFVTGKKATSSGAGGGFELPTSLPQAAIDSVPASKNSFVPDAKSAEVSAPASINIAELTGNTAKASLSTPTTTPASGGGYSPGSTSSAGGYPSATADYPGPGYSPSSSGNTLR